MFIGLLQDFTGVIPAQNLNELMDISNKLRTNDNASKLRINYQIVRVNNISNYNSKKSDSYQNLIKQGDFALFLELSHENAQQEIDFS